EVASATRETLSSATRASAVTPRRWSSWLVGVTIGTVLSALALIALNQWIGPFARFRRPVGPPPSLRQLTFRRGLVAPARFAADGRTIVYSAAWDGPPIELYTTRIESPESRRLDLPAAGLFAVSSSGELAISNHCQWVVGISGCRGTLARVPLTGGL